MMLLLATLLLSAEPAQPTVVVFPFENHTGDASLEVLRHGFADMMATDLTISGGVKVVERERMGALLEELKLQKSAAFDPATAQKAGKMLGATHALLGDFLSSDNNLRVDVRLVEVATGKGEVAATVNGEKARLFELQAQLTQQLLSSLQHRKASLTEGRWTRAPSLDAGMNYSRALAALDAGHLDEAQRGFQELARKSPSFALARVRLEDVARKLEASRAKGRDLTLSSENTLLAHAAIAMAGQDARLSLGYQWARLEILARRLKRALSPGHPQLVMPANRDAALPLARDYASGLLRYAADVDAREAREPDTVYGEAHDTSFPLPAEDAQLAQALKLSSPAWPEQALMMHAHFVLLGQSWMSGNESSLTMAPPLAVADTTTEKAELARAHALLTRLEARAEKYPRQLFQVAQLCLALGDFHDAMGHADDALATWQGYLDRHPTGPMVDQLERRIREASGLARNNRRANLARYQDGLPTCEDMDIRVGLPDTLDREAFTLGLDAVPKVAAQLAQHCTAPKQQATLAHGLQVVALWAAAHQACDAFDLHLRESMAHGGNTHDEPAIRRNRAPLCQPAAAP